MQIRGGWRRLRAGYPGSHSGANVEFDHRFQSLNCPNQGSLAQVFVESLDRSFENVCELDLIFHFDEVLLVLSEIVQGGLVLETNINEISACGEGTSLQDAVGGSS